MGTDVIVREAVEVLTDAERRARILEGAALEIEVRGWDQGWLGKELDGPVCLVGGIGHAADPRMVEVNWYALAAKTWGPGEDGWGLYGYNDCSGRTAEEVTFLLRWRAEEIRDGR